MLCYLLLLFNATKRTESFQKCFFFSIYLDHEIIFEYKIWLKQKMARGEAGPKRAKQRRWWWSLYLSILFMVPWRIRTMNPEDLFWRSRSHIFTRLKRSASNWGSLCRRKHKRRSVWLLSIPLKIQNYLASFPPFSEF